MVLDCIDSGSLHPYLFCYQKLKEFDYDYDKIRSINKQVLMVRFVNQTNPLVDMIIKS